MRKKNEEEIQFDLISKKNVIIWFKKFEYEWLKMKIKFRKFQNDLKIIFNNDNFKMIK